MKRSIRILATLLLPLTLPLASCDDEPTAAERFCDAAAGSMQPCEGEGGCHEALLADCATLAGLLNDQVLDHGATCMEGGGEMIGCMRESTAALTPTQAHRDLAADFCSSCALGVSGCESVFFADDEDEAEDESARAGAVIVPLSDSLANQIASSCTSGLTCSATFAGCAQAEIVKAGLPTQVVTCLVDEIFLGDGSGTCD
jgi:hypothetical protein